MFDQVMAGTSRTAEEVVFFKHSVKVKKVKVRTLDIAPLRGTPPQKRSEVCTYKQNDAATAILNPIRGL